MGAPEAPRHTAKRTHADVEAYLAKLPPHARALAGELRRLAKATVKDARENLYYGVPFFFVDGVGFCYVSPAKKHLTFGIVWGASIGAAGSQLEGTGKSPIRKVTLAYDDPVPDDAREWIARSAAVAREMAETNKRPETHKRAEASEPPSAKKARSSREAQPATKARPARKARTPSRSKRGA